VYVTVGKLSGDPNRHDARMRRIEERPGLVETPGNGPRVDDMHRVEQSQHPTLAVRTADLARIGHPPSPQSPLHLPAACSPPLQRVPVRAHVEENGTMLARWVRRGALCGSLVPEAIRRARPASGRRGATAATAACRAEARF